MLNIFIITQEEPFYIPKIIEYICKNSRDTYNITGYTVLQPYRKNKSYLHWFKERFKVYDYRELFIAGMLFVYTKSYNILNYSNSSYSVKSVFNKYQITEYQTNDINSGEYINSVKKNNVDAVVSVSSPQLFKEELLTLPKYYCINAHGTLLPRHRGVFGSWWTLFSGDEIGGSTIHTMELKLDAGEILWQKEFPIEEDDTQYSIAYKTKRDMAEGIVEILNQLSNGTINKINPKYESSYHRAPTKHQGREFHKKGYRIIKMRDIKYILSKEFDLKK